MSFAADLHDVLVGAVGDLVDGGGGLDGDVCLALEGVCEGVGQGLHASCAKVEEGIAALFGHAYNFGVAGHGVHELFFALGHVSDKSAVVGHVVCPVGAVEDAASAETVNVAAVDAVDHGRAQVVAYGGAAADFFDPCRYGQVFLRHGLAAPAATEEAQTGPEGVEEEWFAEHLEDGGFGGHGDEVVGVVDVSGAVGG